MGLFRVVSAVVGVLCCCAAYAAQPPAPAFEAVSIKPTQPGSPGGPGPFVSASPRRLQARGTLLFFIEFAHGIRNTQIEGGHRSFPRQQPFDLCLQIVSGCKRAGWFVTQRSLRLSSPAEARR